MRQHSRHRVGGMPTFEGEPELLVADPGGDGAVAVDVDVRGHPDQHPLPSLRQTREVGDLAARIQHDAPDPESRTAARNSSCDFALPCMMMRAFSTPPAMSGGQLTG